MATAALPSRIVWHRHWFVLLRGIALPAAGILALAIAAILGRGIHSMVTMFVLIVGSLGLLVRAFTTFGRAPRRDGRTPTAELRTVLYRVSTPIRLLMVVVALALALWTIAVSVGSLGGFALAEKYLTLTYVLWLILFTAWLIFNAVDWGNDVYILTSDRVIDQIRFPLLYDQRTEARLDQIQNVQYTQGFLAGVFDYGNITVETAGRTQAVLFVQVPHPKRIQQTIFLMIDQLNERRMLAEASGRQEELLRWFTGYHELAGRIELLSMPEEIPRFRTIRPDWRINENPGTRYETWIGYDTESHATDNRYPSRTRSHWGEGRGRFREFILARQPGRIYLKIWVRLIPPDPAQPGEVFGTRELTVRVL